MPHTMKRSFLYVLFLVDFLTTAARNVPPVAMSHEWQHESQNVRLGPPPPVLNGQGFTLEGEEKKKKPSPFNEATAFRLPLMPDFYGFYLMEAATPKHNFTAYFIFKGDKVYTAVPMSQIHDYMAWAKRQARDPKALRTTMRSIAPEEIPKVPMNLTEQIIDENLIDYMISDFFTPLFRFDSLMMLPPELRPNLDTLGVNDPHRQLPYLYGAADAKYDFKDGVTAISSFRWSGHTYSVHTSCSSEELGAMMQRNRQTQPTDYRFTAYREGEDPAEKPIGYNDFLNALVLIKRNLYFHRRLREIRAALPKNYYSEADKMVQAALDSAARADTQQHAAKSATAARFVYGTKALLKYANTHIRFPKQSDFSSGTCVIRFAVDPNGSVSAVQMAQSLGEPFDLEAMSVIRSLPRFIPAFHNGMPVRSWFTLPIHFNME